MRKGMSNQAAGIALLAMGIIIGASLVFVTTHLSAVAGPRTVTVTTTATHILIITQTVSVVETVSYIHVSATVDSCQWGGTHEYCEVSSVILAMPTLPPAGPAA